MRDYETAFMWLSDAKIVNCCYNTTAPNIGLKLNMERTTLKCYMADTGLLISHAFDEKRIVSDELYRKLLMDKLEVAAGHKLYFYSNTDKEDANNRMEIDFLIRKDTVTSRHNIIPIEAKSSSGYTITSLQKCVRKFGGFVILPTVVHSSDSRIDGDIRYLPLYMVPLL